MQDSVFPTSRQKITFDTASVNQLTLLTRYTYLCVAKFQNTLCVVFLALPILIKELTRAF